MISIEELLEKAREIGASDLHIKAGSPPIFRVEGILKIGNGFPSFTVKDTKDIVMAITTERQKLFLRRNLGLDISFEVPGQGRYRVNIFYQRGSLALAIRIIPSKIRSIKELMLPSVVEKLALQERGLILVTGVAGTGKSTTLASMIEHINQKKRTRIITIEEPIEYIFEDKKSIISQREVGTDTPSFSIGLKEALRQDPNVIMVGEMRDLITVETALQASETGHLVLSTLHTLDTKETVNRVIAVFPPQQQSEVRVQLASVLKAVISQRLVQAESGTRLPAVEVLVTTPRIRELILDPMRMDEIKKSVAEGYIPYGMQTFEQSLFYLWKKGLITRDTALDFATDRENLALRMQGITTDQEDRYWRIFEELAAGKDPFKAAQELSLDKKINELVNDN